MGKNYPAEGKKGVHYAQGKIGKVSNVSYWRPNADGNTPAFDSVFDFPADADFYESNPFGTFDNAYHLQGYRDDGTVGLEHRGDVTSIGQTISSGDWWRYTFDLGPGDQVLYLNIVLDTGWYHIGTALVDTYIDNKFKGEISAPDTYGFDKFVSYSIGPLFRQRRCACHCNCVP